MAASRVLVSLALACVLLGTPLAALACAGWCLPEVHAAHGQPASADCHGSARRTGPSVTADLAPECLDVAIAARLSGLAPPRMTSGPATVALPVCLTVPVPRLVSDAPAGACSRGASARPPGSPTVLRI